MTELMLSRRHFLAGLIATPIAGVALARPALAISRTGHPPPECLSFQLITKGQRCCSPRP